MDDTIEYRTGSDIIEMQTRDLILELDPIQIKLQSRFTIIQTLIECNPKNQQYETFISPTLLIYQIYHIVELKEKYPSGDESNFTNNWEMETKMRDWIV